MKLYLDHNAFICALKSSSISQAIATLKANSHQFFYSPAHIEEIYKAELEKGESYQDLKTELLETISDITNNQELLPSLNQGVIIQTESPYECYKTVQGYDTTQRVEDDSMLRYQEDRAVFEQNRKNDKSFINLSNLDAASIWRHDYIVKGLEELNENMPMLIERHNNSDDVVVFKLICGINRELPLDLRFEQGMYEVKLKNSHKCLEYVIELLFRILNMSGYNAEKKEHTSISGTHDVSHAIYATETDVLLTTDERFSKKGRAVYHFLGVPTQVIYCIQDDIAKVLLSFN